MSESQVAEYRKAYVEQLDAALSGVDTFKPKSEMLQGKWSQMVWPATSSAEHQPATGVASETLKEVGKASVTLPDSFVRGLRTLAGAGADQGRTSIRDSSDTFRLG